MEMEREGFEPSIRITRTTDWQSVALVHLAISPIHRVKIEKVHLYLSLLFFYLFLLYRYLQLLSTIPIP